MQGQNHIKSISDRNCKRKLKHTFHFQQHFFGEILVVYEIMWKHLIEPDRLHNTI